MLTIFKRKYAFLLFFGSNFYAETGIDLSERIIIDGINDFTIDEYVLYDSGVLLESPYDSYWGEYNDIKQMKITWDESYIYIAVDACSHNNNLLLFIDIFDDYGIEDMNQLNAWQRAFKFYNINPDFFIGNWDTNDTPQFWKIEEGGSIQANLVPNVETFSTINTGNLLGSMEIKVPWEILFYNDARSLQQFPSIKLLSVITSSDDFQSGPDSAPDNIGGMANDTGKMVILDNYAKILIDEDGDGAPDMNVSPQKRTSFYKKPPLTPQALLVHEVKFPNGKTFVPSEKKLEFELFTNRNVNYNVEVFNLNGDYINMADKKSNIEYIEENKYKISFEWNGKNQSGSIVPFGVYILCFIADSGELRHNEAIVLIK